MFIQKTEKDPMVIMPDSRGTGFSPNKYKGDLIRVKPSRDRDVFFLQMLDHHREKFAPAIGSGVFVTPQALNKLLK